MSVIKRKITKVGKVLWDVDFGKLNGKRLRSSFATEEKADEAIDRFEKDRKKQGDVWLSFPIAERNRFLSIFSEIKSSGITLQEVWDGYKEWQKEKAAKPVIKSISYREAVEKLEQIKAKSGKDERYVKDMGLLLMKFAEGQEEREIQDFKAGELQRWFDSQAWGLSTRKSNMGRFSSLWTVAVNNQWVTENIVDRLEKVGKIAVTPEKFDNPTCLRLLAWSLANDQHKRVIAPLALGMFCGMRPEEITHPDFGWHLIDLKHGQITVPAKVAKDGDARYPNILPTAKLWLKLAKDLQNELPPVNERRLIDSICELANVTHWPHDVLRKTAATHLYSHYKDAGKVVMELGNSIRILLKHYIAKARDDESIEFWKLTPEVAEAELKKIKSSVAQSKLSANENATDGDSSE